MSERQIVIGCITNTEYLKQIKDEWNLNYIESKAAKNLCNWSFEYFNKHEKAPMRNIETILLKKVKRKKIKKELAEEIETDILQDLNEQYENQDNDLDVLLSDTREYFTQRQWELHQEEVQALFDKGQILEARKKQEEFKFNVGGEDEGIDLADDSVNEKIDKAFDSNTQIVVKFDGALGKFWNDELTKGSFVSILAPEKRGKCLPGTQKVLLASGKVMTINDMIIKNKRNIISLNEKTGEFVKTKVAEFYSNGIKSVYEVETRSGRKVQVTKNHPFLTPDGWKDLFEIDIGTFIAVPKKVKVFGNKTLPLHQTKLLAYFLADGCTINYKYGNNTTTIISYSKGELAIQKDFSKCIKRMDCIANWNGHECRVYNSKRNKGKHNLNHVKHFLENHNMMDKKSYQKVIPNIVYKFDKKSLALFLRTLFTGDGWCTPTTTASYEIGYSSSSEIMVRQIQELLTRFGIVSKIRVRKTTHKDAWQCVIRDYMNHVRFYENIGFLFRKQEKLKEGLLRKEEYRSFVEKLPYKIAQNFHDEVRNEIGLKESYKLFKKAPNVREQIAKKAPIMFQSFSEVKDTRTGKKYFNSNILWDEIVNVKFVGNMETYDLSVKKHHNFIAENVLVHNTFLLLEFMMRAYEQGKKIAFFQAGDMTEGQQLIRTAIYLTQKSNKEKFMGKQYIPVVDCVKNQNDTCNRKIRASKFGPFKEKTEKEIREEITYEELVDAKIKNKFYRNCYNCLNWQNNPWGAVWLEEFDNGTNPLTAREAKKAWKKFFTNNNQVKLSTHANGELTINKMNNILDAWKLKGFEPELILADYADLIVGQTMNEMRHSIDTVWRGLRGMSQKRDALTVSPTQADSKSYLQDLLTRSNFSEDKRKLAHVTAMYGLNQDTKGRERKIGVMRYNKIVLREDGFHESDQVHVIQKLSIGRPILDSYF